MAGINFRKIAMGLRDLALFQDNVEQSFKQVSDSPFFRGKLITVTTANAEVKINTGLNRKVQGWFLTEDEYGFFVYRVIGTNAEENKGILTLSFDGPGEAKLWVF